jgi:biofilm PGA synthesis N-glycosyltransferase PgaC
MGGAQVMLRNVGVLGRSSRIGLRLLMLEMMVSVAWCYLLAIFSAGAIFHVTVTLAAGSVPTITAGDGALILTGLCLLQFVVGTFMDHRYDPTAWRAVILIPFYPAAFWILQFVATLVAYPRVLIRRRGRPATWISPDRGHP